MRKGFTILLFIVAALSVGVAVAMATPPTKVLAHHYTGNNPQVCTSSDQVNTSDVDYQTQAAWVTAGSPNGHWILGGCPETAPPPPPPGDPSGWPSSSGSLSGDFTCSPVTLTSTDDANGFGALDFNGPFGTFATLPIFGSGDYSILNGSGAESEPYLIVRFSDDTQAFVYATDVEGPGTRYSTLAGNTYETRSQALAEYGTKQVSSVTLAVDNGDLSIEVFGVAPDNCAGVAATLPPPPNHMFLCYSKFQTDGGAVFTNAEALALLADPTSGYWAPFAILGTTTDGPNISGYHLACNPTGVTPTNQYLYANNDGSPEIAPYAALAAGSAGYDIAK